MDPAEIAARRRLVGLTADEFGHALDVNPRTIRSWEAGRDRPRPGALTDLVALVDKHTAEVNRLDGSGVIIELPDGPQPRGWYLALAARLVDRDRNVMLAWHARP